MSFSLEFFNLKERLSRQRLIALICYVVVGIVLMFLLAGKSSVDIESIAVSQDEEYIAFFETGRGQRICCYRTDGSLAFEFEILSAISAGGYCTLWFQDEELCALFYRTDTIVHFSMDGTILKSVDNAAEEYPPNFSSFCKKGNQYIYSGDKIDVVYNKGSFLGYWIFGFERYLAITLQNEEMKIIYAWNADRNVTN